MALLQAEAIFAALDRHGVEYVLIGGLAAVLHGSPLPTVDADICPSSTSDNLARLAAALDELDARIRTPDTPEGVKFPRTAAFLSGLSLLTLLTRAGDLDLSFTPAGTSGYADLRCGRRWFRSESSKYLSPHWKMSSGPKKQRIGPKICAPCPRYACFSAKSGARAELNHTV